MKNRIQTASLVLAFAFTAGAAWAKLPPPPPVDPAAKAAADEKKAAADAKGKAELEAAMDHAVKNYHGNLKQAGKPVPKASPVAATATPKPGDAKAPDKAPEKGAKKS